MRISQNEKIDWFSISLVGFIFFYSLFALERIKRIGSFVVEGHSTTNEIWILLLVISLLYVKGTRFKSIFYKYNRESQGLVFILCLVILVSGFYTQSISQYLYAVVIFILPIILYFSFSKFNYSSILVLYKYFLISLLFYSILVIVVSLNYNFFMSLLGNDTSNYRYDSQFRAQMMLGSSITVSMFFTISLPLTFYLYYNFKEKIWRFLAMIAILFNIIATLILLSRVAIICSIVILSYYLLFIKISKKFWQRFIFILVISLALFFSFQNLDLSRLTTGFDISNNSEQERFSAVNLGLHIFADYPIVGSGMGRFFEREYEVREITVNGTSGLIDPHNVFLLLLSETGLLGFAVFLLFLLSIVRSFYLIGDNLLRKTAYLTLFSIFFTALGGSQLVNEISFSIIIWIYLGLFHAISIQNRE